MNVKLSENPSLQRLLDCFEDDSCNDRQDFFVLRVASEWLTSFETGRKSGEEKAPSNSQSVTKSEMRRANRHQCLVKHTPLRASG